MKLPEAHRTSLAGLRVLNIFITACLLFACSSPHQQAPVSDRQQPPSFKVKSYIVSAGDTLFSIAWRYGIDYKRLARHNHLALGDTIYPGQNLRLDVESLSSKATLKNDSVAVSKPPTPKRPKIKASKPEPARTKVASSSPFQWRWPSSGSVLSRFSNTNGLNKGIDIAGQVGESINSAGPGSVVYAGFGLRGYGNLLIIKHNERYLSAYAHNRKLLVKEGDSVKSGQKIAEMGSSGTNRIKLHFEIRRDGKPVDPLRYLPKR